MIGRQHWPKVTGIQKKIMQHMRVTRVLEARENGNVLFLADGKQYIVEPSGEVMSGGARGQPEGPQPEEEFIKKWEEAELPKREEWLARIVHPIWYKTRHWFELPRGTQQTLLKRYFLGTLPDVVPTVGAKTIKDLQKAYEEAKRTNKDEFSIAGFDFATSYAKYLLEYLLEVRKVPIDTPLQDILRKAPDVVPYVPNPEYEKAMTELAEWYVKHRRKLTLRDMRPIAKKYFPTQEKADEFYNYLASPEGGPEFGKILRLAAYKAKWMPPRELPFVLPQAVSAEQDLFQYYEVPPTAY